MRATTKLSKASSVHGIDIDEVSLVDVPAVPGALVMIQKNFQEAGMADEIDVDADLFDRQGNVLPADYDFTPGEIIYDEAGQAFIFDPDSVEDGANQRDEVEVGKGAFFQGGAAPAKQAQSALSKSLVDELRETLAKGASDTTTRSVLSKALEAVEASDARANQAVEIAKSERAIRLTGQFIEVAKGYHVPSDPAELGGVLMRMSETMSDADCGVIHKALTSAGEILFQELGITGNATADGSDPMEQANQYAEAAVSKGGTSTISKAKGVEAFYLENPAAYDEYIASKR